MPAAVLKASGGKGKRWDTNTPSLPSRSTVKKTMRYSLRVCVMSLAARN